MLSPDTFNALSTRQKTDVLLQQGSFLYTRDEPAFSVDGYKLDDFFVEIFYSKDTLPKAIFRSFERKEMSPSFLPEDKIHYLYHHIVSRHTA